MEKLVLLKHPKVWPDTNLKIILLNYQNNYVGCPNMLLDYQNFLQYYSLCLNVLYKIFIVQQNYFQIYI